MPKVSVIIPVYNAQNYLRQCVDSVLEQTFGDLEIVLVNDGSTDLSPQICKEYQSRDKRISSFDTANNGLSAARNFGIDKSTGEYILFVDADDELYPHAVEHLVEVIESSGASIACGAWINSSDKPGLVSENSVVKIRCGKDHCVDVLFQKSGTDNAAWAKLYKRALFDTMRFSNCMYEDLDLFPRLLLSVDKVAISSNIVYFYRKHNGSFLNSWSDSRRDIIKVTQRLTDTMAGVSSLHLRAAMHRHFSACFNLLIDLLKYCPSDVETINLCYSSICKLRTGIIFEPNSRLKNRIGALASFVGLDILKRIL